MLKSMTGYGKAVVETAAVLVTVEIKSLNSKFSDIYCRVPRQHSMREIEIRNQLTQGLERGKIECTLTVQRKQAGASGAAINHSLLGAYLQELKESVQSNNLTNVADGVLLQTALTMPEVLNTTTVLSDEESEQEWQAVSQALSRAIAECNQFRLREGEVVKAQFLTNVAAIAKGLALVKTQDVNRIPAVRERLSKAVGDLLNDESFDKNRFEQELIYYIEKYDISEEKSRLATHIDYFGEVIAKEGNGKKLNFISQEMGREINTIGSKANDALIQRYVVEMKDELEKIKEQTMNVL